MTLFREVFAVLEDDDDRAASRAGSRRDLDNATRVIWACCSNSGFHGEERGGDMMRLLLHDAQLTFQW